ncbi:nitrate- and nitrite sensing domain-containing protein [Streptomyces gobiensis]|uniref:sensor histidine kinase n=1 Tax=Streptomyces gobiensis TaxID=2875706 RepID=UPI001E293D00|nr:nitrate- and nitrite sensing domain-containing protein [Streptomyces gobiensis]UGY94784.1 nitrate- and nitrite sensing domain-containing protein [Streptomyces gobiensis]
MRFRGNTIRRKIVALLLVPLVALTSIWAFATVITSREARQLLNVAHIVDKIGYPAEETVQAIQRERRQALIYRADPRRSDALTELHQQQRATDKVVNRIRVNAGDVRGELPQDSQKRLDTLLEELDGLESLRAKVERNTVSRADAFAAYNAVVDPSYELLGTLNALENVRLDKEARALVAVSRARELVSREDALMAAALAAGRMTKKELREFSDRVAERNIIYSTNLQMLPDEDRLTFEDYWDGADGRTLKSFEDAVVDAGAGGAVKAVNAERWDAATSTVLDDLEQMDRAAAERYTERVEPAALSVLLKAGIAGVLGFLAVLASVVVSFRIGRGLVRDLGTLRREAHEASGVRLPSVMRRLAAGEHVDVETEAPRLEYGPDEMGQVGQALNTLQRAAIEAAVKQADMRRGVSEVFVNLARRNQVLLHRQLTLLDTMERRTEDPEELADLFRLDHMTTRMRRHAEGLVILSGAAPSRQWRKPVQLMDVVRAAVAEVEDYERIEVRRLPRLAVDGPAVADLTHLIAELLENATVFSPPHTAVQVLGARVANGFTLEIHDRGLGMAPEMLLEANLRLAETPEFELSDTDRLGLFVVSRLAQRQGVRISLQPSPYGGTTAVVLIPGSVLTEVSGAGRDALERGRDEDTGSHGLGALARMPVSLPERETPVPLGLGGKPGGSAGPRPKGGPIELESALDDFDETEDSVGSLFRDLQSRHSRHDTGPTPEQHQQAHDDPEADSGLQPAHHDGPVPLPRRRPGAANGPVLVSDHGRPVGNDRGEHRGAADRRERDEEPQRPTTVGGLPRRVRQASLAPQLKTADRDTGDDGPEEGPRSPVAARAPEPPEERDADEVRSRMASLQRGWQRGREQNDRTTPEGDGR